jgi:hypothetical protein
VSVCDHARDARSRTHAGGAFAPHKAASSALLASRKLRAVAASMLQMPGSFRLAGAAPDDNNSMPSPLHGASRAVHPPVPATLLVLLRHEHGPPPVEGGGGADDGDSQLQLQ